MDMEKLVALCRRRGFIFQSSEIYGGINGFWDYGPLGVELKRNIKEAWWHDMVHNPPPGPDGEEIAMVGVDCAIIMNPRVWEASGHVAGFADPMVDCKTCRRRYRADKVYFAGLYPEPPPRQNVFFRRPPPRPPRLIRADHPEGRPRLRGRRPKRGPRPPPAGA